MPPARSPRTAREAKAVVSAPASGVAQTAPTPPERAFFSFSRAFAVFFPAPPVSASLSAMMSVRPIRLALRRSTRTRLCLARGFGEPSPSPSSSPFVSARPRRALARERETGAIALRGLATWGRFCFFWRGRWRPLVSVSSRSRLPVRDAPPSERIVVRADHRQWFHTFWCVAAPSSPPWQTPEVAVKLRSGSAFDGNRAGVPGVPTRGRARPGRATRSRLLLPQHLIRRPAERATSYVADVGARPPLSSRSSTAVLLAADAPTAVGRRWRRGQSGPETQHPRAKCRQCIVQRARRRRRAKARVEDSVATRRGDDLGRPDYILHFAGRRRPYGTRCSWRNHSLSSRAPTSRTTSIAASWRSRPRHNAIASMVHRRGARSFLPSRAAKTD